jgi:Pyridoxamine 5'-phosphate oxidase
MGKSYSEIDDRLADWAGKQKKFFVSTAPLSADGLINCPPKGLDTLRIPGPRRVAFLDLPGSGIETVAHLKENARIVLMMCAFDGPPRIVRLHGRGRAIEPHESAFAALLAEFPAQACRSVIVVDVARISAICGFGVPLYEHKASRPSLPNWINSQSEADLADYLRDNNSASLDGLPGLGA